MSTWQVWGNWPDRSPGVPRAVRARWVTPPSESGGLGCARAGPHLPRTPARKLGEGLCQPDLLLADLCGWPWLEGLWVRELCVFMWGTRHERVHEPELRVFLSESCRQSTDRAPTPCSPPLLPPLAPSLAERASARTPKRHPHPHPYQPATPATPGPGRPRRADRGRSSGGLRAFWTLGA